MDLLRATALIPDESGAFSIDIPDGWQQGRGAFGGLVLGAMARAMVLSEDSKERCLRTLTGELAGPVLPGPARIEVTPLRRGSGLSFLEARLLQEGATLARASGLLGQPREHRPHWCKEPPPELFRSFEERLVVPLLPPIAPAFSQYFEFRPSGPLPFSGGTEPFTEGWIRPVAPLSAWSELEVVATADAWWPTLFSIEQAPRPAATVAFTLEILRDLKTISPHSPLLHRARSEAASDGFFIEFRELWAPDGGLVALNQQTFVVIR